MPSCNPSHALLWDRDFYTWPSLKLHCSLLPCSGGSEPAGLEKIRKLIFVRTWWSQNSPGLGCWNSRYLPLRSSDLEPRNSHDNLTKRHRASLRSAVLKCSDESTRSLYLYPSVGSATRSTWSHTQGFFAVLTCVHLRTLCELISAELCCRVPLIGHPKWCLCFWESNESDEFLSAPRDTTHTHS